MHEGADSQIPEEDEVPRGEPADYEDAVEEVARKYAEALQRLADL